MKEPAAKTFDWLLKHKIAIGACVFLAIAGFYLWTEHNAHLLGFLPYGLLLLCPLIHLFMHKGHGGHGQGEREDERGSSEKEEEHHHH